MEMTPTMATATAVFVKFAEKPSGMTVSDRSSVKAVIIYIKKEVYLEHNFRYSSSTAIAYLI
jgi:hypothetical protein